MIVLHTTDPNYKAPARVKVLGQFYNATYLGTEDHRTAFALVLSGHAELTARNPQRAYWYALHVIKGRWPEAEAVIVTHPRWAYQYAREVIKDRWPEAEAVIATNPRWACWYAHCIIKGRWPEAEAVIATDHYYTDQYEQEFGVRL